MKKFIISLGLILLSLSSFSQETRIRHIGFSVGPSTPLSDFAKNNPYHASSGYAFKGYHANFNFSYQYNKHFGIAALWTGNVHQVDLQKMILSLGPRETSMGWQFETTGWFSGSLLGGLLITLPFNKVNFDIKGLVGIAASRSPRFYVTAFKAGSYARIKQHEATKMSAAANFGAGLRYNIFRRFSLAANLDYFITKPEFKVSTTSDFEFSSQDEMKQLITMKNISFGIGYRLK